MAELTEYAYSLKMHFLTLYFQGQAAYTLSGRPADATLEKRLFLFTTLFNFIQHPWMEAFSGVKCRHWTANLVKYAGVTFTTTQTVWLGSWCGSGLILCCIKLKKGCGDWLQKKHSLSRSALQIVTILLVLGCFDVPIPSPIYNMNIWDKAVFF